MITKAQALEASAFHFGNCTRSIGPRGGVVEHSIVYRRNGRTQTWKRDAERWRVPVKRGLKDYGDITPERAHEWHTESDCPLRATSEAVSTIRHSTRVQEVRIPVFREPFHRGVCLCGWVGVEHANMMHAVADTLSHERTVIATTTGEG